MEALKETLGAFVEKGIDMTLVVIENADQPDEYVRLQLHDGVVYGEVGSRMWAEPFQPLPQDAVTALGLLGFAGGAPKRNFVRDGLAVDSTELTRLTEQLFHVAYGRRPGLDIVVSTNSEEVYQLLKDRGCWVGHLLSDNPMQIGLFDLDHVERHLKRRSCTVFRNQNSGELMTIWSWNESLGIGVKLFFSADCDGNVLRIAGTCDRPVRGRRRWGEVIRACNKWNSEQRWPKAYLTPAVVEGKAFGWVETSVDIPVAAGVHRAMVEDLVDTATSANLQFYAWMHEKLDWSTYAAGVP